MTNTTSNTAFNKHLKLPDGTILGLQTKEDKGAIKSGLYLHDGDTNTQGVKLEQLEKVFAVIDELSSQIDPNSYTMNIKEEVRKRIPDWKRGATADNRKKDVVAAVVVDKKSISPEESHNALIRKIETTIQHMQTGMSFQSRSMADEIQGLLSSGEIKIEPEKKKEQKPIRIETGVEGVKVYIGPNLGEPGQNIKMMVENIRNLDAENFAFAISDVKRAVNKLFTDAGQPEQLHFEQAKKGPNFFEVSSAGCDRQGLLVALCPGHFKTEPVVEVQKPVVTERKPFNERARELLTSLRGEFDKLFVDPYDLAYIKDEDFVAKLASTEENGQALLSMNRYLGKLRVAYDDTHTATSLEDGQGHRKLVHANGGDPLTKFSGGVSTLKDFFGDYYEPIFNEKSQPRNFDSAFLGVQELQRIVDDTKEYKAAMQKTHDALPSVVKDDVQWSEIEDQHFVQLDAFKQKLATAAQTLKAEYSEEIAKTKPQPAATKIGR